MLKTVYLPARVLDRHVGGNTTYTRAIAKGLSHAGINVERLPMLNGKALNALSETITSRRVPKDGSTVIHFTADTGQLLPLKAPSVVTVHGVASRWIDTARNPRQEFIWRQRVRSAIKHTDSVITVSESSANDIAEVFEIDRTSISVIPHGIEMPSDGEKPELSGRLSTLVDQRYVLYLGNIEPRKNLLALIQAFSSSALSGEGLKLVIAGKPAWNASEIMKQINLSNTTYLGFVSEVEKRSLLKNAELFAFPSLYEGFGFPVLEALSHGTPTICSNFGSLKDVAGPALRFEDVSVDGVISGLVAALNDQKTLARMNISGPEWAEKFSWDKSVSQHLDVYEELCR